MQVVYYSNHSRNTERFVKKLAVPATRIEDGVPENTILITPTYGDAAIPAVVKRALRDPDARANICAVIGTGNINFGDNYCAGAKKLASKLGVPLLYRLEMAGTPEDVDTVLTILRDFETEVAVTAPERAQA